MGKLVKPRRQQKTRIVSCQLCGTVLDIEYGDDIKAIKLKSPKRAERNGEEVIALASVIAADVKKIDPKHKLLGAKFWKLVDAVDQYFGNKPRKASMSKQANCADCGLPYEDFGIDTTLPNLQWKELTPDGVSLLCANCICKRAAKMPNVLAARTVIEFMW